MNKNTLETLKMRGLRRINKVIAPIFIALLVVGTFFAGQIYKTENAYAIEELPEEGTISLISAKNYEFIVKHDGDLSGKLTATGGSDGSGGSYSVWLGGKDHETRYTSGGKGGFGGSVDFSTAVKKGQIINVNIINGKEGGSYGYLYGGGGGTGGGGTPGGSGGTSGSNGRGGGGGSGGTGVNISIDGVNVAAAYGGGGGGGGGTASNANGSRGGDGTGYGGTITSVSTVWSVTLSTMKKVLTPQDSYEGINRIAIATERTVELLENIVSSGALGINTTVPDKIVAISGKEFNEMIKGSEKTMGGASGGVIIENIDKKDGYVKVSGRIDEVGNKEIEIDNIKYFFKVYK